MKDEKKTASLSKYILNKERASTNIAYFWSASVDRPANDQRC